MPSALKRAKFQMLDELLAGLGGIDPSRICLDPPPGHATEKDLIRYLHQADKRVFELVDRTLVEKPMGLKESFLAAILIKLIGVYSDTHGDLGMVTSPDGPMKLFAGLVRFPDVAFVFWDRLPDRKVPTAPVPELAPDLAVEVLSESNTRAELIRKRGEYFRAGVKLVWLVDPATRTACPITSPDDFQELTDSDVLDGGELLPDLRIPLAELFDKLPSEPKNPPVAASGGGGIHATGQYARLPRPMA